MAYFKTKSYTGVRDKYYSIDKAIPSHYSPPYVGEMLCTYLQHREKNINMKLPKYKFNTWSINDKTMGLETTVYFSTKRISVAEIRSFVHH